MSDEQPRADAYVDPLDEAPEADPRFRGPLVVAAWLLAALALVPTGAAFLLGPVGMACGLVAHAKGHPHGFAAAVTAAVTTVVGLALQFLLLGGISGNA